MKKRQYLILEAESIDELMVNVNEHIDHHYEPLGGMVTDAKFMYYQTMTISIEGISALEQHKGTHVAVEEDLKIRSN